MAAVSAIPPREREVIRAIIKALRTTDTTDMVALSASYGVKQRLSGIAGRCAQSADLLEALIGGRPCGQPEPDDLRHVLLEDLVLSLDGTLADVEASKRKGYWHRDLPKLRAEADRIREARRGLPGY